AANQSASPSGAAGVSCAMIAVSGSSKHRAISPVSHRLMSNSSVIAIKAERVEFDRARIAGFAVHLIAVERSRLLDLVNPDGRAAEVGAVGRRVDGFATGQQTMH